MPSLVMFRFLAGKTKHFLLPEQHFQLISASQTMTKAAVFHG